MSLIEELKKLTLDQDVLLKKKIENIISKNKRYIKDKLKMEALKGDNEAIYEFSKFYTLDNIELDQLYNDGKIGIKLLCKELRIYIENDDELRGLEVFEIPYINDDKKYSGLKVGFRW